MRGRLSIGGRHGNRLRCIVYFSTNTYICSCSLSLTNSGKLCSRVLSCYHGNKAKKKVFKKYLVLFADLLTLRVNIK